MIDLEADKAELQSENTKLRDILAGILECDKEAAGGSLCDCVDNDGDYYQSALLAGALEAKADAEHKASILQGENAKLRDILARILECNKEADGGCILDRVNGGWQYQSLALEKLLELAEIALKPAEQSA